MDSVWKFSHLTLSMVCRDEATLLKPLLFAAVGGLAFLAAVNAALNSVY